MPRIGCHAREWSAAVTLTIATVLVASEAFAVTIGPPIQIGTILASAIPETSGMVDSRANANTFWVHNDSGDSARFYAVSHQGTLLGTFPLAGATALDWEDIGIGPSPGGGSYLYLGDIGDNNAIRPYVTIYRTAEPQTTTGATIPAASYTAVKLQYAGGARDAESLFVDPLTSDVYIISKTSTPQIFSAPASVFDNPAQTTTMMSLGNLGAPLSKATAADISPDGKYIVVRSSKSTTGYLFERDAGQSVADALHSPGIPLILGAETQGEAIGWAADGKSFYTTTESNGLSTEPIHSYAFAALTGDYNNNGVVDAADYTVWRDTFGSTTDRRADGDNSGVVNAADYDIWATSLAAGSGTGASGLQAVPEPTSAVLLLLGAAAIAMTSRY